MGLQVERALLGDIIIEETGIYVFAAERLAYFLAEELTQAGRTALTGEVLSPGQAETVAGSLSRKTEDRTAVVASLRLDAVVSEMASLSRAKAKELIGSGRVLVNGVEEEASRILAPGDQVSVRGTGKFRFVEDSGSTRKDRKKIRYQKYI